VLLDRRGVFPDDLEVQIRRRTANGATVDNRHMKVLGGQTVVRVENVTGGFEYRARGGDDDTMPWTELLIVELPKIQELKVVVHPPAYSGLPSSTESQVVDALIGSILELRGKVDRPIEAASLKPNSPDFVLPKIEIASGGRSFHAPSADVLWTVEKSGVFELEFIDQQGMRFGRSARIELHAIEDQSPSIAWEAPEEHVFATASATLPIKATVKDDLAVHKIQLRYLRSRK